MRRISSRLTPLFKFGYPALFGVGIIDMNPLWGRSAAYNAPDMPPLFLPVLLAFFFTYTLWIGWSAKKVDTDGRNLYIYGYRTEVTIPLSDVRDVRQFVFSDPRRITIYLEHPTAFGGKIVFLATYQPFIFFGEHPIVRELLDMASVQRRAKDSSSSLI